MTSNEIKLTMLVREIATDRLLTIRQSLEAYDRLMQLYLNFNPSIEFKDSCDIKRIGYSYIRNAYVLRAIEEEDVGNDEACEEYRKRLEEVCKKRLKQFEKALTKQFEKALTKTVEKKS